MVGGDWLVLALLGAVGTLGYRLWGFVRQWLRRTLTVRLTIDDPAAYAWLAEWLAERTQDQDSSEAVAAWSRQNL